MSRIRLADIPDIGALCDLGRELQAQSVYADVKPNEEKFRRLLASMMGIKTATVLVVVDDEDKPQGFLLGVVDELFFSKMRHGTDISLYVRKGFRNLAPSLIKTFIKWAESKPRVVRITLGVSAGIVGKDRLGEMYESLGLSPVGGIFVKNVERT